jgi:molecular chaperone GrpE
MSDAEDPKRPGANGEADDDEAGVALAPEPPPSREDYETLRREVADLKDQLLRRRAEFENYKRRTERERQSLGVDAAADLLKGLVATLDHLELALKSDASDAQLREGVVLIQRGLIAELEGRGLRVEDPVGAPFDPERHQAVSYEPGEQPEGTVLRVLAKGYAFKERLIRPALVVVAQGRPVPGDTETRDALH